MVKIKATQWAIGLFGLFFATFLYLYLRDWYSWQGDTKSRPQPTILELKREVQNLPFANQIKVTKYFDKDASVSVIGKFESSLTPLQIADTFKTSMPQNGWRLEQEKWDRYPSLKFCRDGIAANIRLAATDETTQATIQLAWTYQTQSSDYCAVKAFRQALH